LKNLIDTGFLFLKKKSKNVINVEHLFAIDPVNQMVVTNAPNFLFFHQKKCTAPHTPRRKSETDRRLCGAKQKFA
jgi:hypothetical protein